MTRNDLEYTRHLIGDVDLGALRSPEVERLENSVRPGLSGHYSQVELRVAVAMSVLTPDLSWDESVEVHHAAIVGRSDSAHARNLLDRAVDCAIAYGVGWRRQVESGQPRTLHHRWPRAFSWMLFQFSEAVVAGNRFLEDSVNCLQTAGGLEYLEDADTVYKVANALLNWYLDGTVDVLIRGPLTVSFCSSGATVQSGNQSHCWTIPHFSKLALEPQGKAVIAAFKNKPPLECQDHVIIRAGYLESTIKILEGPRNAGEERILSDADSALIDGVFRELACSCGSFYCAERHSLNSWQPDAGLQTSILRAVRGKLPTPHANSFADSMYGAYQARGCLLRSDGTPWGRILKGTFEAETEQRENPVGACREYTGTMECLFYLPVKLSFEPHQLRQCKNRITSSVTILKPTADGTRVTVPSPSVVCSCLLGDSDAACPFCGAPRNDGPTTLVWKPNASFTHEYLVGYVVADGQEVLDSEAVNLRKQRKRVKRHD